MRKGTDGQRHINPSIHLCQCNLGVLQPAIPKRTRARRAHHTRLYSVHIRRAGVAILGPMRGLERVCRARDALGPVLCVPRQTHAGLDPRAGVGERNAVGMARRARRAPEDILVKVHGACRARLAVGAVGARVAKITHAVGLGVAPRGRDRVRWARGAVGRKVAEVRLERVSRALHALPCRGVGKQSGDTQALLGEHRGRGEGTVVLGACGAGPDPALRFVCADGARVADSLVVRTIVPG